MSRILRTTERYFVKLVSIMLAATLAGLLALGVATALGVM